MRIYLVILLIILHPSLYGSSNDMPSWGARSSGLANACVMLPDFWSVFHNQAGLAFLNRIEIGFHHQSGFVKETDRQALALVMPTATGTLASSFSYYGYTHYHESKWGLAYGRLLGEHFAAGIQMDYLSTKISGIYGTASMLTFEAGIMVRIMEQMYLGAHVFNPVQWRTGVYEGKIPVIFRIGAGYGFSESVWISLEMEKQAVKPVMPKLGIEYEPVDRFFIRSGISVNPLMNHFGVGYTWQSLQADIAFGYHHILGYLPDFSLKYAF
jgi:hypothetical protein